MTKNKSILYSLLLLFLLVFAFMMSFSINENVSFAADDDIINYITMSKVTSSDPTKAIVEFKYSMYVVTKADRGNYYYGKWDDTKKSPEDITIEVSTFDYTAIAGVDYKETKKTLTLYAGQSSTRLSIDLYNDENETTYCVDYNYQDYMRQFYVKALSISSNAKFRSESPRTITCNCSYDYRISSYVTTGLMKAYTTYTKSIDNFSIGSSGSSAKKRTKDIAWNFDNEHPEIWKQYISTGLANYYFAYSGKVNSSDALQWDGGVDVHYKDYYIYEIEEDGYYTGNKFDSRYLYKRSSYNGVNGNIEFGGDTSYPTSNDLNKPDSNKNAYHDFNGEQWGKLYTQLKDDTLYLHYYINGGYGRSLSDGKMYIKVADVINPSIKDWYCDKEYLEGNNNMIYIRVRFTEPVRVTNSTALKLVCSYNGQPVSNNKTRLTMDYVGGSCTDTLVFGADISKVDFNYAVTSLYPTGLSNYNTVVDFGNNPLANCGTSDNYAYDSTKCTYYSNHVLPSSGTHSGTFGLKISFDPRTPKVDKTSAEEIVPKSIRTTFNGQVLVNSMATNGYLEYEWTTSSNAPATYSSKVTCNTSNSKDGDVFFPVTSAGLSGEYYLHLRAISYYGRVSDHVAVGKFLFDNMPYEIDFHDDFDSNGDPVAADLEYCGQPYQQLKDRSISFDVIETIPNCDSGINQITLLYSKSSQWTSSMWTDDETAKTQLIYETDGANMGVSIADPVMKDGKRIYKVTMTIYGMGMLGIPEGENAKFYLGVQVSDKLNNVIDKEKSTRCQYQFFFDTREMYSSSYSINMTPIVTADSIPVIDYSKGTPRITCQFDTPATQVVGIQVKKPSYVFAENEEKVDYFDGTKWFTTSYASSNPDKVDIYLKKDVADAAGYYEISVKVLVGSGLNAQYKYTYDYLVYFTNGMKENTTNYSYIYSGKILTNKVYMVQGTKYYYKDKDGVVTTVNYGNSVKSDAIFSDYNAAYKYIEFMELQDMDILVIGPADQSIADQLNSNLNSNYMKGVNETKQAATNQVWIRYKRTTWSDTTANTDWGYYYYSTGTTYINKNAFSSALSEAVSTIVNSILSRHGVSTYLSKSNSYLDSNRFPSTEEEQIHPSLESTPTTMSGAAYNTALIYEGDPSIYSPYVNYQNRSVFLASSIAWDFTKYNKAFVKIGTSFVRISQDNGSSLKDQVPNSNIYTIREIDEYGVRDFEVFIDKEAAVVTCSLITSDNPDGTKTTFEHRPEIAQYNITGKELVILDMSTEYDSLAYIEIYTAGTYTLKEILSITDVKNNALKGGYKLGAGRYYIDIYDRSGNYYRIYALLNSTALNPVVKESPNIAITLEVPDRTSDDIDEFKVYLDGEWLSDVKFSDTLRFTQTGIYKFVIKDWYGNKAVLEYEFTRKSPELIWKYTVADTTYTYLTDEDIEAQREEERQSAIERGIDPETLVFEEVEQYMNIVSLGMFDFNVLTSSTRIQIIFNSTLAFDYEFILEEGQTAPQLSTAMDSNLNTILIITSDKAWTIKISYHEYPTIYGIYTYVLDNQAPMINVGYTMTEYGNNDDPKNFDAETFVEGQIVTPDSILYYTENQIGRQIISGATVSTDFLDITFTDSSLVKKVNVYIDGELYRAYKAETGKSIESISVSKFGNYVIEAYDALGNKGEFKFKNTGSNSVRYFVDENENELTKDQLSYVKTIDGVVTYTKSEYGHASQMIAFPLTEDATVKYKITNQYNETDYLMLYCSSTQVYKFDYIVQVLEEGQNKSIVPVYSSDPLIDIAKMSAGTWVTVGEFLKLTVKVKVDDDNMIYVLAEPTEDAPLITIETKINLSEEFEPTYFKTVLSVAKSDIIIKTIDGELVKTNQKDVVICINKEFAIYKAGIPSVVKEVYLSYSESGEFKEGTLVYDGSEEIKDFDLSKDGFYKVTIVNIYGNITTYTIHVSSTCQVIIRTYSQDDYTNTYVGDYDELICANKYIRIEVYTTSVSYKLLKEGLSYKPNRTMTEEGYYWLEVEEQGKYTITISDEYNNVIIRNLEIREAPLTVNDGVVYNFNEYALRKSENYTNQKLSIDVTKFGAIKYVAVEFASSNSNASQFTDDQKFVVVYDDIAQNKLISSNTELEEVVGKLGTGTYRIIFRDIYGNKSTKTIRYREESTIKITRITRNLGVEEDYPLETAMQVGIWSNNIIAIDSDAGKAKIIVDGVETTFPKTFQFITDVKQGELRFDVQYVDEYGFNYSFEVVLIRRELSLELDPTINTTLLSNTQTTIQSIIVHTQSETTTTYSINGGDKIVYKDGDILREDGTYRFEETDFAGNMAILIVKKDNTCEYTFKTDEEDILTNGVVVNDATVRFSTINNDSAKIYKIFKDGEVYEDSTIATFNVAGKWEFIIKDDIGNESYFVFYLIKHRLNEFIYDTPYNFSIKQLWMKDSQGERYSYLHKAIQYSEYSHIELTEDGLYSISMQSSVTGEYVTFTITIDTSNPPVTLNGCNEGEETVETVKLNGLELNDVVYVYKDGELIETYNITELSSGPEISEGGKYRIVVVNEQGNVTELTFTRKHIANTAGSALIIVALIAVAIGLFVGILLRNKSRTDK